MNMYSVSLREDGTDNCGPISLKKIIIVKDVVKPWHDEDGILTISLYDFLLDDKSLEL